MANTYHNLFPFTTVRPEQAQIFPVTVMFEAPIIAGKYVFNKQTTPAKIFGQLPQNQTGIIAGVMISANCTPADFAQNVDEPLGLRVYHGGNKTPVNNSPFPFSQFSDGDNYSLWWRITGSPKRPYEDDYLLEVTGSVNQIADMSENVLKLRISFNYWRVDNYAFDTERYYRELLQKLGANVPDALSGVIGRKPGRG